MFGQCTHGDKTGLTRAIKNKAGRTLNKNETKRNSSSHRPMTRAKFDPFLFSSSRVNKERYENVEYGARKQIKVGEASFPIIN